MRRSSRRLASTAGSSLASLVGSANRRAPALIAPQQNVSYTYEELDLMARCLASGLEDVGYKPGSVALSDVPNVAENIVLQLALSHVGAAIMTPPRCTAREVRRLRHHLCGRNCGLAGARGGDCSSSDTDREPRGKRRRPSSSLSNRRFPRAPLALPSPWGLSCCRRG